MPPFIRFIATYGTPITLISIATICASLFHLKPENPPPILEENNTDIADIRTEIRRDLAARKGTPGNIYRIPYRCESRETSCQRLLSRQIRSFDIDDRIPAMDGRIPAMDGRIPAMDSRIPAIDGRHYTRRATWSLDLYDDICIENSECPDNFVIEYYIE